MLNRDVARRAGEEFHLHELLREMSAGALSTRMTDVVEGLGGTIHDRHTIEVPFGALRDLTAGAGSAGGYLVATDTRAVADALRPVSAVVAAGATVLTGLQGHASIPKLTASDTGYWLATEGTATTPSQPALAQITLSPKTGAVYTAFSRQLALQAPDLARALEADMRKVIGALIDAAALNGIGSAGTPLGVLRTVGIGAVSGGSLDWADIVGMRKSVRDANGAEATTAWVCGTDVAELLGKRERASGNGAFILDGGLIDNRPVHVSTNVPSGTLLCADWSVVHLGFWGGITFEVNPYQSFTTGGMSARLMATLDIAISYPAAIVAATSIT